jgi:hypothetical protein
VSRPRPGMWRPPSRWPLWLRVADWSTRRLVEFARWRAFNRWPGTLGRSRHLRYTGNSLIVAARIEVRRLQGCGGSDWAVQAKERRP